MKHTAYHLRPNKAAERFAFIEAIRRLERLGEGGLADYTYFGLGGPYLEDFRLLTEFFPDIDMVSIENENETYKRQDFHLPSSKVKLELDELSSYIARYDPGNMKSVFWLDYTNLKYSHFEDFKALLGLVAEKSMIKVTLRCHPKDYGSNKTGCAKEQEAEKFRVEFSNVMPQPSVDPPRYLPEFATLLQDMLRVAAGQVFPPAAAISTFVPVSSFCYSDGTGMFTLTGIVCDNDSRGAVRHIYEDWEFANLEWSPPTLINVPVLSTKERLHLQRLLPSTSTSGPTLLKALGYLIDNSTPKTEAALKQYAAFHRYSPYFLRGVP